MGIDVAAVAELIRHVDESVIGDWQTQLAEHDVGAKAEGEIVTSADLASEAALTEGLRAMEDVPVVGEEAVDANPSLLAVIGEADAVWVVDPIDGTTNFAAGSTDWAIMVAFVERGETVASWMWHRASDSMAIAERGGGAWVNDRRVRMPDVAKPAEEMRGVIKTRFLPDPWRTHFAGGELFGSVGDGRNCAGVDYPDLVAGAVDFLFYWRTLPWDHAPGVLFAREAGARAARPDRTEWAPPQDRQGLLVASPAHWDMIADLLTPGGGRRAGSRGRAPM